MVTAGQTPERLRSALSLVFWALIGLLVLFVLEQLFYFVLFEIAQDAFGLGSRMLGLVRIVSLVTGLGDMALRVLLIVGLARVAGNGPPGARGAAVGATIVIGLQALTAFVGLLSTLKAQLGDSGDPFIPWEIYRFVLVFRLAAWVAGVVLLVVTFHQVGKALETRTPVAAGVLAIVFVSMSAFTIAYRMFADSWEHHWMWLAGELLLEVGIASALLVSLSAVLRRPPGPFQPTREWEAPARGLGLYRTAVITRILIVVGGAVVLALAALADLRAIAVLVAVIVPLGTLVCGVLLIVGLTGFVSVPAQSGARELATFSLVLHALALLVEIGGVIAGALVLMKMGGGSYDTDLDDLRQSASKLQLLVSLGQAMALGASVLLVVALRRIALHVGAPELASRATPVITLVAVTAGAALLVRVAGSSPKLAGVGLLLLGIAVIVLAITAIIMYVGYIGRIRAVMIEGHHQEATGS